MAKVKPDPNHDPGSGSNPSPVNDNGKPAPSANDNGGATTPASNALATSALTALTAAFKRVDLSVVSNRPLRPLMQFKSREGGIWAHGQKRTVVELESEWAVNPTTFQWGYVCWGDGNKVLGNVSVPIDRDRPDLSTLPDRGFEWTEEMSVHLKCTSGVDAGTEVVFKTNTQGGRNELLQLIEAVRNRLGEQHEGRVVPVVQLGNSSYAHAQYGKTYVPVMTIVDWIGLDGPTKSAPAPKPTPAPASPAGAAEPRRRRVS